MFLYATCFIGACVGSTTSGIRVVHYVIIWKFMVASIKKIFFQPMAVISIRLNRSPVDSLIVDLPLCYFIVNIFLVLGGGCFMVLVDDTDYVTGMSSVIATLIQYRPGIWSSGTV
jgi:trk system potassium uptake protein TrkH